MFALIDDSIVDLENFKKRFSNVDLKQVDKDIRDSKQEKVMLLDGVCVKVQMVKIEEHENTFIARVK